MKAKDPYQLLKIWQLKDIAVLSLPFILFLFITITQSRRWSTIELGISILLAVMACFHLIFKSKKNISEIVEISNNQNNQLEYSSSLLLQQEATSELQKIQLAKVKEKYAIYNYKYIIPQHALKLTCFWNGALLILMCCFSLFNFSNDTNNHKEKDNAPIQINSSSDTSSSGSISTIALHIQPPQYTEISNYSSSDLNIKIPEASIISWKFETTGEAQDIKIILENKGTKNLNRNLFFQDKFISSDIYRYEYSVAQHETTSEYYSIEVIKDQYASARISGINQYNKIGWNELQPISLIGEAEDEYGLEEVFILATVAKGSGESVKFREEKFSFKDFKSGTSYFRSSYSFDLKQLKLEPGDELFFHLRVKDNCPFRSQWTKSESIVVHIPDTASYALSESTGMSIDLIPEFFRSQRQIIIDSEKLIKIKNDISLDSFKRASNQLGFDQKILRLKYGQFLGEENESGIAIENEVDQEDKDHDHDHDGHDHRDHNHSEAYENARNILSEFKHDHDHGDHQGIGIPEDEKKTTEQNPSRPSWVEELSHNHDNMEEATFFDVSIISKLRSALSEMWDAELHLRLYDPKTSLPFQYASLELLKEIKNHARIYVQRVGFDPPFINENEKRLSGNQNEIINPNILISNYQEDYLKSMQSILNQLTECPYEQVSLYTYKAIDILSKIAIENPYYLPILTTLQNEATKHEYNRQNIIDAIIQTIPARAQEVKGTSYSAHQISLETIRNLELN